MSTYAIVQTGGKQYRVSPGDVIDVELLPSEAGSAVKLDNVLLVSREGDVSVGAPFVAGAHVLAEVKEQGKAEKVIVFKYKAKTRFRRKNGHRQPFTRLLVKDIVVGG